MARSEPRPREFYETQGEQWQGEQLEFHCSQDSITAAVIQMTRDYASEFGTLLDVGCGAELQYDREIAGWGKLVFGVDFAFSFLALAEHNVIPLVQGDATALPYRNAAFDAVICSETLEHIVPVEKAVEDIARVLRRDGLLFVTVPNLWNASRLIQMVKKRDLSIPLMAGHVMEYSPRALRRILSRWFVVERWYPV